MCSAPAAQTSTHRWRPRTCPADLHSIPLRYSHTRLRRRTVPTAAYRATNAGSKVWYSKAVYAQCEGKLTVVMVVVTEQIPDDLLARIQILLCAIAPCNRLVKVNDRPAIECLLDSLS